MSQNPYESSPRDAAARSESAGAAAAPPHKLSAMGCALVLAAAFLGWLLAGGQLAITSVVMRDAAKDLLATSDEGLIGKWYGYCVAAFLLGAAAGGYAFGRIGDRLGRAKAMSLAILCYSVLSGLTYFVSEPWQLLAMRFLTCMGVGGMWPNGIALVSEAWPDISRPFLAGAIGTAANVGIFFMSILTGVIHVDVDAWRWVMLVGAAPAVLGLLVWRLVPESPRWLAEQQSAGDALKKTSSNPDVFQPPLLWITLVGIVLGAVPLFGGWGSSNWVIPWAGDVGENLTPPDLGLKARMLSARSITGVIGSLLGGLLASVMGRRTCYFTMSLAALVCSQYFFWFLQPNDPSFLYWFSALGLFSGVFFGWLPLCLPEMFPTRVRSTGAGVSFNFGRILTAIAVLASAWLLNEVFAGDYAQIGRATSLVYAMGVVVIFLAPKTSGEELQK